MLADIRIVQVSASWVLFEFPMIKKIIRVTKTSLDWWFAVIDESILTGAGFLLWHWMCGKSKKGVPHKLHWLTQVQGTWFWREDQLLSSKWLQRYKNCLEQQLFFCPEIEHGCPCIWPNFKVKFQLHNTWLRYFGRLFYLHVGFFGKLIPSFGPHFTQREKCVCLTSWLTLPKDSGKSFLPLSWKDETTNTSLYGWLQSLISLTSQGNWTIKAFKASHQHSQSEPQNCLHHWTRLLQGHSLCCNCIDLLPWIEPTDWMGRLHCRPYTY